MTVTSPRVSFGLYALAVKPDSTPSMADLQTFSKVADLKTDSATALPYATYEPSFWLLDGYYKFKPAADASVHVGIMSLAQSDASGNFAVAPVLTIDFSQAQTSDGLALHFSQYSEDWASSINVAYYDASAVLIRADDYNPTTYDFQTGETVADFKQIVITFYSTNKPYRYLRVTGIDYGTLIYFDSADIKQASIVEETDLLSGEARFNTFDLRLHSDDGDFSIINPQGYYQYLQQYQPIAVYEQVGNQTLFMGQFYTKDWTNRTDTEIEFHCIDLLGVLDTIPSHGGLWTGSDLEDVVDALLAPLYIPYDLDASLAAVQVAGWIPNCTLREALQQLALAAGAYLDCSRSGQLKIYPTPIASTGTATATITKADKGISQALALAPLVTGVEVTAHSYSTTATTETLYSATLAAGTYTIEWSAPHHTLSASNATITESGVNYAVITVASTLAVSLTGRTYLDTKRIASVYLTPLPSGTKPNILKVTDCYTINPANAAAVAQRIYDYKLQRYLQKFTAFAPTTYQTGDVVVVDTLYSQKIRCTVEKMAIDLTRGMVAQVELTGVLNT